MTMLGKHLRTVFITGLLILVPVVITYLVLRLVFNFVDGILQPAIEQGFGKRIPGLGLATLIILIYLIGLVGANVLGQKAIQWGQNFLLKFPLVRLVYSAAKDLVESFSNQQATGFKRVVTIEYPRAATWTVGFLTGITLDENGNTLGVVYIPTAPTPNSRWVAILPMDQIYDTDLTVPAAMRFVLSGGIATPTRIRKKPITP
jgi:uncharacterized membrane protein